MGLLRWLYALTFLAAIATAALPSARADSALVLAGGAADDERIYQEIIRLAGGAKNARIGILTASSRPESEDPHRGTSKAVNSRANAAHYEAIFRKLGVTKVEWIPIDLDHVRNNRSPAVIKQVEGLNGLVMGGGNQGRYSTCLQDSQRNDSPVLAAIRRKFKANELVIAGTSAGTAVQVDKNMITGGESDHALMQRRVAATGKGSQLTYERDGGLRFFSYGLLDTHFSERGRQGRLLRLASETRSRLAFGIDENTALVVEKPLGRNPRMRVIGANGVQIFDLAKAKAKRRGGWQLKNVRASYLTHGDRFDYRTRTVSFAKGKQEAIPSRNVHREATEDIFSAVDNRKDRARRNPRSFARVSSHFAASRERTANAHAWRNRGVRVRLSKVSDSASAMTRDKRRSLRSYKNIRVDVRARRSSR